MKNLEIQAATASYKGPRTHGADSRLTPLPIPIPQSTLTTFTLLHTTPFIPLSFLSGSGPACTIRRAKRKGRAGADLLLGVLVLVANKHKRLLHMNYRAPGGSRSPLVFSVPQHFIEARGQDGTIFARVTHLLIGCLTASSRLSSLHRH